MPRDYHIQNIFDLLFGITRNDEFIIKTMVVRFARLMTSIWNVLQFQRAQLRQTSLLKYLPVKHKNTQFYK